VRLDLVVGSNGAGKTTLVRKVLQASVPPGTVFVNADEIAKQRWPDDAQNKSYEAALVAAQTRQALIVAGRPFIAETVFSHPSKLDLITDAQTAGFFVALHVVLVPEDLTVERVKYRVATGGHSVPEEKIRGRYGRMWSLVAQAMLSCETATVYDNSSNGGYEEVAKIVRGVGAGSLNWPAWTPTELTSHPW
jgi:predicted ABC-type ATPase